MDGAAVLGVVFGVDGVLAFLGGSSGGLDVSADFGGRGGFGVDDRAGVEGRPLLAGAFLGVTGV